MMKRVDSFLLFQLVCTGLNLSIVKPFHPKVYITRNRHTSDGHLTTLIIHSECIIKVRYKVRQSSTILH